MGTCLEHLKLDYSKVNHFGGSNYYIHGSNIL